MENPYCFISYSTKNKDIAESVKDKLLSNSISCWMAPYSIPYGSDYSTEIYDAIANCKVFVLILSEQSMNSVYVVKELDLAVSNKRIIIPFRIDEEKLTKSFSFFLCNVQIMHAESTSLTEAMDRLTKFIIDISNNDLASDNMHVFPSQRLQLPGKAMVGRERYIKQIDQMLSENNKLCISGIGGVGKTELVRLFIKYKIDNKSIAIVSYNDYKENLKHTISVMQFEGFDDEKYLQENSSELADKDVSEALYQKKLSMLQQCDDSILLVIDGFNNYEDSDIDIIYTLRCKVLITTRCDFKELPQLKLGDFSDEEQRSIFISCYEDYDENNEADNIYLDKILKLVDNHTLTLKLLASFLNVSGLTIKDLYQDLTSTSVLNLSLYDEIEYDHNYGAIIQHISNLFAMSSLSDEEVKILFELSMLPISGVSKKLFRSWSETGAMTTVDLLVKKGWIQSQRGIISLHPIIYSLIDSKRPDSIEPFKQFLINVCEYLNVPTINEISARSEAELIAYSVANHLKDKSEDACYLFILCGRYIDDYNYWKFFGANDTYNYLILYQAYNRGNDYFSQLEIAYSYLSKAVEIYREMKLDNELLLSKAYSNLGNTCFNLNRYEEAIRFHQLALEGRTKLYGNSDKYILSTRRKLGTCYLTINKPDIALKYYKMNLDAVLEDENHSRILVAKYWYDCGKAYLACKDKENALNCLIKASENLKQMKELNRFATAQICYETASLLIEISEDNIEKASQLLEFGLNSLDTLDSKVTDTLFKKIESKLENL